MVKEEKTTEEVKDEKPSELTPRQWWLYRLLKALSEKEIKVSIKEIIDYQNKYYEAFKLTYDDLYQFNETEGNHSNCPAIYDDVHAINECDRIDKIVCFKNNQFYIGTEKEAIEYHNKLMHTVCRDSHKASIIRQKISQDGQGKLFTYDLVEMEKSKGRDYHEAFIRQESLIKENERLLKKIADLEMKIQMHKNEAQMYKDWYTQLKGKTSNA